MECNLLSVESTFVQLLESLESPGLNYYIRILVTFLKLLLMWPSRNTKEQSIQLTDICETLLCLDRDY